MNFADPTSAYEAPRDASGEENGWHPVVRPAKLEESKHWGLAWIRCQPPMSAGDLEQVLEEKTLVHRGQEPPKEGTPPSVVLCANSTEGLWESVERTQKLFPDVPVLAFGPHTDLPLARAALKVGARGYVHAGMKPDQLVRALKVVSKDEIVAPRKLLEYLVTEPANGETANLDTLPPRQQEVLGLVTEGLSNSHIASRLFLSESTVKQHLRATYKLLEVHNRAQAAKIFQHSAHATKRSGP